MIEWFHVYNDAIEDHVPEPRPVRLHAGHDDCRTCGRVVAQEKPLPGWPCSEPGISRCTHEACRPS